jgi:ribonuclease R
MTKLSIPKPEEILEYLRTDAGRPLKAKELAKGLDVTTSDYDEFRDLLDKLEQNGTLYRVQHQRYAAPGKINLVVGTLHTIRSGAGFVSPEEGGDEDLYIPPDGLASAVHGDRVVARIEKRKRGGRSEGTVIKVIERSRQTVVGVFHTSRNFAYVVPDDKKLSRDVFVAPGQQQDAQEGDVVVLRITNWGNEHLGPAGEVERVLGKHGAPGVDVLAVLYGHELPVEFPQEVIDEAEQVRARGITAEDIEGRTDLRDTLIFTIDPVDAKDHDDALSIEAAGEGLWEVGVHIADVSFYVREGTHLDTEALRRGTSIYLVDRTIPMLPEALSSDLCSLRPHEDRMALSLLLLMDDEANVRKHRLVRSVIRSRHKLAYEDAQAILDGTRTVDPETDAAVHNLLRLSRLLRAQRQQRGSLDFDLPEARVVLNEQGEPIDIKRIERLESHRLIEDYMLLANETIARDASKAKVPFIYRIHEAPDPGKLLQLQEFVATFGLRLGGKAKVTPKDLQQLLDQVKGHVAEGLISTVVLRSMKQARYSAENLGHFGLAAKHYTHFTSPIRRYPDLMVHRMSSAVFIDRAAPPESLSGDLLPEIARISSERERVAVEAERDSVDLKKVEFMEQHLGAEFVGTISSVTAFGCFVLLDRYFVEGLVHVSALDDDYYVYLEDEYALVGERSGRRLRLGDRFKVRVARVNREERKIDFEILEMLEASTVQARPRGGKRDSGRDKRPGGSPRRKKARR